jgi:hypothetical protein
MLTRDDFPPGRVIALNAAIVQVRRLGLSCPIFTMQKDGCRSHGPDAAYAAPEPGHACPLEPWLVHPEGNETLIVSARESAHCFPDWPRRIVVDVEQEFGLPWYTMSAPVAVKIAQSWGETDLLMLGHDAYTTGSTFRVDPDDSMTDDPHGGYRNAGAHAATLAQAAGMTVAWR